MNSSLTAFHQNLISIFRLYEFSLCLLSESLRQMSVFVRMIAGSGLHISPSQLVQGKRIAEPQNLPWGTLISA